MVKVVSMPRPTSSSAKTSEFFIDIPSVLYQSPSSTAKTSSGPMSYSDIKDNATSTPARTNSGSSLSSLYSAELNSPTKSQAYVDVPPSPYPTLSRRGSMVQPISAGSSGSQKENTMPSHGSTVSPQSTDHASPSRKRKLSDAAHRSGAHEVASSKKRARREDEDHVHVAKKNHSSTARNSNVSDEVSEESQERFFYCHQCRRKLDKSEGAHCTTMKQNGKMTRRCGAKYCYRCLLNRYGENLEDIKSSGVPHLQQEKRRHHTQDEDYYFECPRCRDVCNCRMCRKAKGLPPTGKLTSLAHQTGVKSAADLLSKDPNTKGILPGKSKQTQAIATKKSSTKVIPSISAVAAGSKSANARTNGEPKRRGRPPKATLPEKSLPKPIWCRVPTALDLASAEMRMNIREFFLRFASVLDVGKPLLDGLEELSGSSGGSTDTEDEDGMASVPWVSELAVKNMVLALLSVLFEGDVFVKEEAQAVKEAIGDIRTAGSNLTRLWIVLTTMRDALRPHLVEKIVDPLPAPANVVYHTTRSLAKGKQAEGAVHIAVSAQLVPVIAALANWSLETPVIRDALEQAIVVEKEVTRNAREALSRETARWKDRRESFKEKVITTGERSQHKRQLEDIEHAQIIALHTCVQRYAPLGKDHEGRLYYALSPGSAERDAAQQLLAGKSAELKITRRRGGMTNDERKDMTHWSWFVAVWGKIPPGAARKGSADESESESEDEREEESWWGFYESEEVRRLAGWIITECAVEEAELFPSISRNRPRKSTDTVVSMDHSGTGAMSSLSELDSDDEDGHLIGDASIRASGSNVNKHASNHQLAALVKNLKDYADLLQWRVDRVLGAGDLESEKVQDGAVPVKKFYG